MLKRMAVVLSIILSLVLIGLTWGQARYHQGYDKALSDHPQNVFKGKTTVVQSLEEKDPFIYLKGKVGFFRIGGSLW